MENDFRTRQEKKKNRTKDPYNQKSLRIQEALREKRSQVQAIAHAKPPDNKVSS